MAELPHFSLPFSFVDGKAAVVEQDTPEEVATCVEVIVRCPVGFRPELPDFGVDIPAFGQAPLSTAGVREAITEWEPRADVNVTEYSDVVDEAIRTVQVDLTGGG